MLAAWAPSGTSAASWGWTPAWWASYLPYRPYLPYLPYQPYLLISTISTDIWQVGCVRRLEINDKYYSLETAAAGGDIIAGRDIGEDPALELTRAN